MKRFSIVAALTLLLVALFSAVPPLFAQDNPRDRDRDVSVGVGTRTVDDYLRDRGFEPFTWRRQVFRIGGTYTLGVDDATREVIVVAGDAVIEGRVAGDVVAILGTTRLASTAIIDGSLVVVGGSATADAGARVFRDLAVIGARFDAPSEFRPGGDHVIVDARGFGGRIQDVITWLTRGLLWGRLIVPNLPWIWAIVGIVFLVYLALSLTFDRSIRRSTKTLSERPLSSFVVGLLVLLLAGPICLLLAVSVVGIAVVPVVLCALLVAMIIGRVGAARWIGAGILHESEADNRLQSQRSFVIGFAIICVAYMIPILGFATWAIVGVLGLGSATLAFMAEYRRENPITPRPVRVAATPAPAPAPAFASSPVVEPVFSGVPPMPVSSSSADAFDAAPAMPERPASVPLDILSFPRAYFRDRVASGVLDAILIVFLWQFLDPFTRDNVIMLLLLGYFVGFWTWKGTTVGGIICQLRVVRVDGEPLRFVDALVRGLSGIFSLIVVGLGFLWIIRDPERQAWHDRIAGTYVVKVPRNWPI